WRGGGCADSPFICAMIPLDRPLHGQALPSGEELLILERCARSEGTGLNAASLGGVWRLERLWNRSARAAPLMVGLLRSLAARLEIEASQGRLHLCNAVNLASLELRFLGEATLQGRRPLLLFRFDRLELVLAGRVLLQRPLQPPDPRRQPFFALIARSAAACDGQSDGIPWLAARGRGGGLALWCLQSGGGSGGGSAGSP
ncbi:MAG: hypothetical protein VKI83_11540, partial [Synechococcaceae cyanobacterium]|nr:hypothetical protein [Synechococcaceae cyanobacterium]